MDLENLLAREKELTSITTKSPFRPFKAWLEVIDYCNGLSPIQNLFNHELSPKSITLAESPGDKKLLIRGWGQICLVEVGSAASFLFIVVEPSVLIKSFILLLALVFLSLVFTRGLQDLTKYQPGWTVLLTKTGPQLKINGLPTIPSDQIVQSFHITPDMIDFSVAMALAELQREIVRHNAELETLNLIDEGYRNITTVHHQIAEIERRLDRQDKQS